ncbi:MAG: hypothetical protein ACRDSZ_04625 [Pseudonocardiaceae bacterium]
MRPSAVPSPLTVYPAELVVACSGQPAAAADALGELGEGERQQQ